jgi:hypothetical protein
MESGIFLTKHAAILLNNRSAVADLWGYLTLSDGGPQRIQVDIPHQFQKISLPVAEN